MSTHEQNKAAVRDCFSQAAAGNFDALPGLLAEGYVLHPEGIRGAGVGWTFMKRPGREPLTVSAVRHAGAPRRTDRAESNPRRGRCAARWCNR